MPPPPADEPCLPYPTRTINALIREVASLRIGGASGGLT